MHAVNTRTFFLATQIVRTQRLGAVREERLEHFHLNDTSLFWGLPVDGTNVTYIRAHVLPASNLQVIKFGWKDDVRERDKIDYYIDIVSIPERSRERWHVRDLYLDLVVLEGERCEVLDTDEYLEALAEGHLGKLEAEHALTVAHATLNALSKYGNSLESYLSAQGIRLRWQDDFS